MREARHVLKKEKLAIALGAAPEYKTVVWRGFELYVRPILGAREANCFFDSVMSACYDASRDLFFPEMVDFAFRAAVLVWYAGVELPESVEEQWRVVYASDLYDRVLAEICGAQVAALSRAVELCMGGLAAKMKL